MKRDLLQDLRDGKQLSVKEQLLLICKLSTPAMLAQLSSILMSYIDASMVGRLGTREAAGIGLVASSTWLICGFCFACAMGFTVQVAQLIGAKRNEDARNLLKIAFISCGVFVLFLCGITLVCSPFVPYWLGADSSFYHEAFIYFFIFCLSLPFVQFNNLSAGMLQCSGNMKFPGLMQILMCILNVILNYVFIFIFKLGVAGAAVATLLARLISTVFLILYLLFYSDVLSFRQSEKFHFDYSYLTKAWKIGLPVAFEQLIMSGGQVAFTRIVSPLGAVALSANSFAITAEGLCYMPAYGLGAAATTLTGQSFGAGRKQLTWQLGWLTTLTGMVLMVVTGGLMFIFSKQMISFLSPEPQIIKLGATILMIEAFSEPFYGASLVANGAFRGTGDTFIPSCFKFFSMWLIRIPLALFLRSRYGLEGVWFAMSFELCIRGGLFLLRLGTRKWIK